MKPRAKKILFWSLGSILGLIVILGVAGYFWLDAMIRSAIVNFGSQAFGTRVEVRDFRTRLLAGEVRLDGLVVANPQGYQSPEAFSFQQFRVKVNLASIFEPQLVIEEILIDGLHIDFEATLRGTSNLTDLQHNLERNLGGGTAAPETPEPEPATEPEAVAEAPAAEPEAAQTVLIRDFRLVNTEFSLSSALLKQSVVLPLPEIHLTNLGDEETTRSEMLAFVYEKILLAVLEAVKQSNLDEALGESLEKLSAGLSEIGQNLGAGLNQVGQELGKSGESTVKDAVSAVEGLLKGLPGKR